ncbi:transcriptional regulator family: Fungal Specific TF [Aspergillus niger]|nr:transcriptional regulator family: Fungal Specific TF [Aspergillus niger]KAI2851267.1 transcriptional regulator family: Fungal Specific TF [Aspergillus niger]KAI2858501.1 transcriptional regulator family: Fungal Specific TF [Aspergillus niger]KAI2914352.1 transcriptional regulator family: Fungal Specific TF [Aspergillus niger]KAI2928545.1 transcriptional regulator family: Fungal Specific TF [Aspergillus niger]
MHGWESQLNIPLNEFNIPAGAPKLGTVPISDLLHAELDQLYFDRAHIFVPVLNARRYLSWTRDDSKSLPRRCLQYAMWTITTSMSAQLEHLCEPLYQSARELLGCLQLGDENSNVDQIEHVQALLILAVYEFTHHTFRRGWMSAGQGIRLAQLMNLHKIDLNKEGRAGPIEASGLEDPVRTEETRRVFWVAYILDRLISSRQESPLTFDERVIATRLPAREEAFQTGQLSQTTGFLSKTIIEDRPLLKAELSEMVILASLCGKTVLHRQQAAAEQADCGISNSFWDRHRWLDAILAKKGQAILTLQPVTSTMPAELASLTPNLMIQSALLYHCMTLQLLAGGIESSEMVLKSRQRAILAAQEIIRLTGAVLQLSYFEIAPFTPLPILLCAEVLMIYQDTDASCALQLQEVLGMVQNLANANHLCREWAIQHPDLFGSESDFVHIEEESHG